MWHSLAHNISGQCWLSEWPYRASLSSGHGGARDLFLLGWATSASLSPSANSDNFPSSLLRRVHSRGTARVPGTSRHSRGPVDSGRRLGNVSRAGTAASGACHKRVLEGGLWWRISRRRGLDPGRELIAAEVLNQ